MLPFNTAKPIFKTGFMSTKDFMKEVSVIVEVTETKRMFNIESKKLSEFSDIQYAMYCKAMSN